MEIEDYFESLITAAKLTGWEIEKEYSLNMNDNLVLYHPEKRILIELYWYDNFLKFFTIKSSATFYDVNVSRERNQYKEFIEEIIKIL